MRFSSAFLSFALAGTILVAQPSALQKSTLQKDDWQVVKALQRDQQIRVSLRAGGTHKGSLQEVSDSAITLSDGQVLNSADVRRVWVKRHGHRGMHALIGAGVTHHGPQHSPDHSHPPELARPRRHRVTAGSARP